jgi:hypothetical protein
VILLTARLKAQGTDTPEGHAHGGRTRCPAEVASLLAKAGADLSLRGTGAPGFADKTAYDLAMERGMLALSTELKPKP